MWRQRVQAALSKCLDEVGRRKVRGTFGGLENLARALLADEEELVGGQGVKCSNAFEPLG